MSENHLQAAPGNEGAADGQAHRRLPVGVPQCVRSIGAIVALVVLPNGGAAAHDARTQAPLAQPPGQSVLISAVFYDGYAPNDADEAVQLWNVGTDPIDLSGWSVTDGEGISGFPDGALLGPGVRWWLARDETAFRSSFGHFPDWAWTGTPHIARIMATQGAGPALANSGDEVILRDARGVALDVVVYAPRPGSEVSQVGWHGPAAAPYFTGAIARSHQVLHRKLHLTHAVPVVDTDSADDWAGNYPDPVAGRRVRYPGWDLELEFAEAAAMPRWSELGRLEIAVAPDNLYEFLARHVASASSTIDLMAYTFDHAALADAMARRAEAGVAIRVLLDGSPAGGFDLNGRWVAARLSRAGADVFWMDGGGSVGRRYRSAHAKAIVIDGTTVVLATENPSLGAAPRDDPTDGTAGRRGFALATDAPSVVSWVQGLFNRDVDPGAHLDIRPYQERDPTRGAPAPDVAPDWSGGGAGYTPVAPLPMTARGVFTYEPLASPAGAIGPASPLFDLLAAVGPGDEVRVMQLREPPRWGPSDAQFTNPRLEAYLEAARRGAKVRVLLDGHFDDPTAASSNRASVDLLVAAARAEGLALEARTGNPTGKGIHAKVVLARLVAGPRAGKWLHLGSLNGTEVASKGNRETAVQVRADAAHDYVAAVFDHDWDVVLPGRLYFPLLVKRLEPGLMSAQVAARWPTHYP